MSTFQRLPRASDEPQLRRIDARSSRQNIEAHFDIFAVLEEREGDSRSPQELLAIFTRRILIENNP